jgi:hypothetical protein
MKLNFTTSIIAALVFFTLDLPAQTPEPPAPNLLVQQAAFIAIGTIQFNGAQCTFTVAESLKGGNAVGAQISVLMPAAAGFAAWFQQAVGASQTILVGTYDVGSNQLTLTHSEKSVWPQGTFPNYFADKTIAGCKDFIEKAHRD